MANLELLKKIGKLHHFGESDVLFMQNDPGDNMYIALKGEFGVYINSFTDFPVKVGSISSGRFFGEMSIIDGWPRSATIISEEDGYALSIEKEKLTLFLESSPDMAGAMLNTLSGRVKSTLDSVRAAGKYVPDLPDELISPKLSTAQDNFIMMVMLSTRLRELNEMLTSDEAVLLPTDKAEWENVALLPKGYINFEKEEIYDTKKLLQRKKITCPYCDNQDTEYIPLFSRLEEKEKTIDQRIIYKDFDILWYSNVVCSNCSYTDTYQEFIKPQEVGMNTLYKGNQFPNKEKFAGFATTHNHTLDEVITSYYLNIACLKKTVNDPFRIAKAWHRLYWIYSDNKADALAKQAAFEAIASYDTYFELKKDSLGTEDHMRLNVIIGELSIAVGNYEKAREHFKTNTVIGRTLNNDFLKQSMKRYGEIKGM